MDQERRSYLSDEILKERSSIGGNLICNDHDCGDSEATCEMFIDRVGAEFIRRGPLHMLVVIRLTFTPGA
jgi:hypothetical protein